MPTKPKDLSPEQLAAWRAAKKALANANIEQRKQVGKLQTLLCELQLDCNAGEFDSPLEDDEEGEKGKKAGEWLIGAVRPLPLMPVR